MMTLEEFVAAHCGDEDDYFHPAAVMARDATSWRTVQEAWQKAGTTTLCWMAGLPGVLSEADARDFLVHVATHGRDVPDSRSRESIAVAKRHAIGWATDDDLAAAHAAAFDAATESGWAGWASDAYMCSAQVARTSVGMVAACNGRLAFEKLRTYRVH